MTSRGAFEEDQSSSAFAPRVAVIAVLLLLVGGCDPPCASYWKLACDSCYDRGCEAARTRAEHNFEDAELCERETASFKRLLDHSGGKELVCGKHGSAPLPSDDLLTTWMCKGGVRLRIGTQNVLINQRAFSVWDLAETSMTLKSALGQGVTCELDRRKEKLLVHCKRPMGDLPATPTGCVDAKSTPKTCKPEHDGQSTCAPDAIRMLECNAGKLEVILYCRGPNGCGSDDGYTTCDETLAKTGEPCSDNWNVQQATDVDTKETLTCQSKKWAPKKTKPPQ